MSNDRMGNLEKFGILVIVILVVVVGVVAITPSDALFPGDASGDGSGVASGAVEPLDDAVPPLKLDLPPDAPSNSPSGDADEPPIWPDLPQNSRSIDPPPRPEPEPVDPEPMDRNSVTPEPIAVPVRVPVRGPTHRTITVQDGDNYYRIAKRELGDIGRWNEVQALNPSVDPRRIKPGDKLRIPTSKSSRGNLGSGRRTDAAPQGTKTYVVKGGDTPTGLSTKFWGTSAHWQYLLDQNGLKVPNDLHEDATIRIPPKPQSSSNSAPKAVVPASRGTETSYVVKPGENVTDIARDQLHDSKRWREILALNGIADPRSLRAGSTIRLPE